MGLLSKSLGISALSIEDPAQPLLPQSAIFESLGLGRSDAGVMVNEKQAMRLTTAYACINLIAEDLSSTSFEAYKGMNDGGVRRATELPVYSLLKHEPNKLMSSMDFRKALIVSRLAWGNGYAWIKRDRGARPVGFYPLAPDKTKAQWIEGQLVYVTTQTETGVPAAIDPVNVIHVKGLTYDGINGLSPIGACKNAFGLALAAEKFGAQFFGNGARATGVLSHPNQLDAEAYENLKKSVREWANGETALRPIILEEGMKWEQMTINPDDAQFISTRQFQRSEIAALFRVPLHLLQDLTRSTNNNIEHQSLDYVRYCLRPLAFAIEQEFNRKLLSGNYFMEHNLNDLMRGDFASQTSGFAALRNMGVYSPNDVLRDMRKNPISSEEGGDTRMVQINMMPLQDLLKDSAAAVHDDPGGEDGTLGDPVTSAKSGHFVQAYRRVFRDAVGRIANRSPRDRGFAERALQPIVASAREAMNGLRYGSPELNDADERAVRALVQEIADGSESWSREDLPTIATLLSQRVFDAFQTA